MVWLLGKQISPINIPIKPNECNSSKLENLEEKTMEKLTLVVVFLLLASCMLICPYFPLLLILI